MSDRTSDIGVNNLEWFGHSDFFLGVEWKFLHFLKDAWFAEFRSSCKCVDPLELSILNQLFNPGHGDVSHASVKEVYIYRGKS